MLCKELLKAAGKEQQEEDETPREGIPTIQPWNINTKVARQRYVTVGTPEYKERLRGGRHFVGTSNGPENRGNCVLCYMTMPCKQGEKRVQHYCKQCGMWMHIECFEAWHTQAKPVSPLFDAVYYLREGLQK